MKKIIAFIIFLFTWYGISAQKDSLTIENSTVSRTFSFARDSAGFYSLAFINKKAAQNYINLQTEEFSITINDSTLDGKNCRYKTHFFHQNKDTQMLAVTLETPFPKVYIQLVYELYENLPLVRKQLIAKMMVISSSHGLLPALIA